MKSYIAFIGIIFSLSLSTYASAAPLSPPDESHVYEVRAYHDFSFPEAVVLETESPVFIIPAMSAPLPPLVSTTNFAFLNPQNFRLYAVRAMGGGRENRSVTYAHIQNIYQLPGFSAVPPSTRRTPILLYPLVGAAKTTIRYKAPQMRGFIIWKCHQNSLTLQHKISIMARHTIQFLVTVEYENRGNHSDSGRANRDRKKLRDKIANDMGNACYNSNQPFVNDTYKVKGTSVKQIRNKNS